MRFREVVSGELSRRQRQNARYSLRGFARALGVHHATLSRLLNDNRPLQARTILSMGPRLGLSLPELESFVCREDMMAIERAVERPAFHPNSRWLASVSGIPVDRVNMALHALLRCGRLRMRTATCWSLVPPEGVD